MSVTRTPDATNTRRSIIAEIWLSESQEEIAQLFEKEEQAYPRQGYGTFLRTPTVDSRTGLFAARFSRYTSCD